MNRSAKPTGFAHAGNIGVQALASIGEDWRAALAKIPDPQFSLIDPVSIYGHAVLGRRAIETFFNPDGKVSKALAIYDA